MTSPLLIVAIAIGIALLMLCLWIMQLQRRQQDIADKTAELHKQLRDLERRANELDEAVHEVRTGALGMGSKLKSLVTDVERLKEQQQELQQMDPEVRLYSQAAKLVAKGADIEELMRECELPRGEAELLMSLHHKP